MMAVFVGGIIVGALLIGSHLGAMLIGFSLGRDARRRLEGKK